MCANEKFQEREMSDEILSNTNESDELATAATSEPTIDDLQNQITELEDAQARAIADYRNLERRTTEGRSELRRLTAASLIINLLPIYDDLMRAIEAVPDALENHEWVGGIGLIREKFHGALDAIGATEIQALAEPFDPRLHEAVGSVAGPDGQIMNVMQSGWAIDEQIVRPTLVMVGNGESQEESLTDEQR